MEKRKICCCRARGWTRVIAWIEITWSISMLIKLGEELREFIIVVSILLNRDYEGEEKIGLALLARAPLILGVILLILIIIMSINLLSGSQSKNTRQINAWLIYMKILLVIGTLFSFAQLFFTHSDGLFVNIVYFCLALTVHVFIIWVVEIHKKETEDWARTCNAFEVELGSETAVVDSSQLEPVPTGVLPAFELDKT